MPTGVVYQLHYRGGGCLLGQTSTGDSWPLPFARAPQHVRIGHTVTFSLAGSGSRSCSGSGGTAGDSCNIFKRKRDGTSNYAGESSKASILHIKSTFQEAAMEYHQVSQRRFGRKAADDWSRRRFAEWLAEWGRVGWWCDLQVSMSLCRMATSPGLLNTSKHVAAHWVRWIFSRHCNLQGSWSSSAIHSSTAMGKGDLALWQW